MHNHLKWNGFCTAIKAIRIMTKAPRIEGYHGHIKNDLHLEFYLDAKGLKNVEWHVLPCYITIVGVALCRAQHGIFEHMTALENLS